MKLDAASPKLVYLAFLISAVALLAGFYVEQFDTTLRTTYYYMFLDALLMGLMGFLWKDFGSKGMDLPYRGAAIAIILMGTGALLVGIGPFLAVNFMYGQGIYLIGFLLGVTPIFMPKK